MNEFTRKLSKSILHPPVVAQSPQAASRLGQQLGNYLLVRFLARGGFAEVYLGEHVHLNTPAAIKILHTLQGSEELERFREEARIVARLRHPHIVSILDFDVKDGVPFLVMDYAPNGSLHQRHPDGSIVSFPLIVSYLLQVADALDYAHTRHYVHRDIKPENLLLGWNDEILLSDFGIAVMAPTAQYGRFDVIGTLSYMSPEQFRGQALPASDQYSLAVVTYEWLCGTCPFRGSGSELMAQHMGSQPPSLRLYNPEVPSALEQVVLRALAKDPHQRYASIGEFARAFSAACPHESILLRESTAPVSFMNAHSDPTVRADVPALTNVLPESRRDQSARILSRRALLLGLGGVATVGILGGLLLYSPGHNSLQSTAHPRSTPKPSPSPTQQPGTLLMTYRGHIDVVDAVAWSPMSGMYIASGSRDRTVRVWEASTGSDQKSYTGHNDDVNSVAWSPNGQQIASASSDNTVQIWDAFKEGKANMTYTGHSDVVNSVAWSMASITPYVASGGNDRIVRIWRPGDGSDVVAWDKHKDNVRSVAWSLDGHYLASASEDQSVMVWDATNTDSDASPIVTYRQHTDVVRAVAWSPSGSYLASASADGTVQVWKALMGGNPLVTYSKHGTGVNTIAWSTDDRLLASGGDDGTARVWQARDGSDVFAYNGHSLNNTNAIYGVMWSPNGAHIASASADKTVQVWIP